MDVRQDSVNKCADDRFGVAGSCLEKHDVLKKFVIAFAACACQTKNMSWFRANL